MTGAAPLPRAALDCFLCGQPMRPDALAGTFRCRPCGFYRSAFPVEINRTAEDRLDETRRERALKALRVANFARLLDAAAPHLAPAATLLDVGSAHGWFLEAAAARGYRVTGLEPDHEVAVRASAAGAPVIEGFFPDALAPGATFDAISFNDVYEHLPDPHAMAEAARARLNPGGVLILNLPMAEGVVFQASRLAARFGASGPLARMWQEGLPSPHLAYYTRRALLTLMRGHGFETLAQGRLPSMTTRGLWARIRYDRSVSAVKAAALYVAAAGIAAVSGLLPADIGYVMLRKS